jgi:hypothetical protein
MTTFLERDLQETASEDRRLTMRSDHQAIDYFPGLRRFLKERLVGQDVPIRFFVNSIAVDEDGRPTVLRRHPASLLAAQSVASLIEPSLSIDEISRVSSGIGFIPHAMYWGWFAYETAVKDQFLNFGLPMWIGDRRAGGQLKLVRVGNWRRNLRKVQIDRRVAQACKLEKPIAAKATKYGLLTDDFLLVSRFMLPECGAEDGRIVPSGPVITMQGGHREGTLAGSDLFRIEKNLGAFLRVIKQRPYFQCVLPVSVDRVAGAPRLSLDVAAWCELDVRGEVVDTGSGGFF